MSGFWILTKDVFVSGLWIDIYILYQWYIFISLTHFTDKICIDKCRVKKLGKVGKAKKVATFIFLSILHNQI
jgi:hypothetical protein